MVAVPGMGLFVRGMGALPAPTGAAAAPAFDMTSALPAPMTAKKSLRLDFIATSSIGIPRRFPGRRGQ
jgi:hypothetical protein